MPWPPSTRSVSATPSASPAAGSPRAPCAGPTAGGYATRPPNASSRPSANRWSSCGARCLTNLLADALTPGTIEIGLGGNRTRRHRSGVRITLSDGTTREAAAVVGADGVGSMVARHLNGSLRRRYAGYTAWRGVAKFALDAEPRRRDGRQRNRIRPRTARARPHLLVRHRTCTRRAAHHPRASSTYLRSKYGAWAEPIPAVLAATDPADVLRNDLYDREDARQWSRGPVVLVGDAAHPMRPHLGQGGCQGLEDAATLAHCVGAGTDLPGAFARYAAFRRPRATALARESRLLGRIVNVRPAHPRRGGDASLVARARRPF